VTVLAPDLGRVRADPNQLEQVIVNLAVNARDAMPAGGKLTIETTNVDLDEVFAQAHLGSVPGPYAMFAVTDTGSGMDATVPRAPVRALFHDQGSWQGDGTGTRHGGTGIVKQSDGYISVLLRGRPRFELQESICRGSRRRSAPRPVRKKAVPRAARRRCSW